ncbi:uncharacterized protein LOC129938780 isoform X2 [Eupeodes corollae]|uniref:uncharacterized protein LOC129938780 isoform X2 n=1 Tax=Eupeodes corollae TaxID=290404 RepID=UPI0024927475|nr:uncharacterized protein LOC129938780 isoform X2 [Eupeodes corollae]
MLPEFLFNVGNSMQDISRDEINLLTGAGSTCDKDMCSSVIRSTSVISPLPLKTSPNIQAVPEVALVHPIKIEEDSSDLYQTPWHHISNQPLEMGSSKLLLQGSDDPLISRGANTVDDDHTSDFNSIISPVPVKTMSSSKSQLKAKLQSAAKRQSSAPKTPKQKGAIKLRFHHQALPAEYLSHYEATQGQHIPKMPQPPKELPPKIIATEKSSPAKNSHENVRNWLQKIAEMQRQTAAAAAKEAKEDSGGEDNTHFEQTLLPPEVDLNANIQKPTKRVVNYSDLPYMGEMTLDNSKPRRGRKPKKADICHLIYKNYGTILPGTPRAAIDGKLMNECNTPIKLDEPLNLCLRDHADSLSASSNDEEESETKTNSNCPTPIATPLDSVTDSLLAANLKMSLPTVRPKEPQNNPTDQPVWTNPPQNANILLHPMSLYYQKLIESGSFAGGNLETINCNNQLALKIPIRNTNLLPLPKIERPSSTTEYPEQLPTPSSVKSENSTTTSASQATNNHPPQKRKRSAIFIPPIPAENNSNPATEVSICKFKFTGGANPSLQEKKMLSVDSDGNYRYYSGTGDKSMRSYEFFPRESLQQSGAVPGMNCAGVFLNATGEKIAIDVPPPSAGLSNELLQIPDSPTSSILLPSVSVATSTRSSPSPFHSPGQVKNSESSNSHPHHQLAHSTSKKKKSRRAAQREKLEKTFKEKGFLIQTQQLESAEGATYCKFRQLKKFTRYLFRNWKDYLPPGELQHPNAAAVAAAAAAAAINNHHQHTPPPPPPASSVIGSILAESYTNHQRSKDTHEMHGIQNM